jgi:hypothetical protein
VKILEAWKGCFAEDEYLAIGLTTLTPVTCSFIALSFPQIEVRTSSFERILFWKIVKQQSVDQKEKPSTRGFKSRTEGSPS